MTWRDCRARKRSCRRAAGGWGAHEIHGLQVGDPYVNGDQFVVRFVFDLTVKQTQQRISLDELGAFTVRGGRVVEERYFVLRGYFSR